jgi:cell division protein FtsB
LQGEYGVFTKLRVEKEQRELSVQRDLLTAERESYENLTRRLGDSYLDLDLLDERARVVLGYARVDEVIIR